MPSGRERGKNIEMIKNESNTYFTYKTALGPMTVVSDGSAVKSVLFGDAIIEYATNAPDALTDITAKQMDEYLAGKRQQFDFPIDPDGTPFQKTVWKELTCIPYGETRTYKQIAQMIGKPKACRAVGNANNKNPIVIIIPCHRVIGSNGSLVGYAYGLEMKEHLIRMERSAKF